MTEEQYDAIIIGTGFSGIYQLIQLRRLGLKCKAVETGSDLGGTWYWNRYPGARVDSDIPSYELSFPELWKGWSWTQKFPNWQELQSYFAYVDDKMDLRKDCRFDTTVKSANWDDQLHVWHVTGEGKDSIYKASARYLVSCTGFASKPYTPGYKGLNTFKGLATHTARWPVACETAGKRIGVVGTGASGVQVIQSLGPHAKHLTVFQRAPNTALPMRPYAINKQIQDHYRPVYEQLFEKLTNTFSGLAYDLIYRPMMKDTPEQRQAVFEELWDLGGFHFWLANYLDIFKDQACNDEAYAFWRKKVCERIKDPVKRELLAPEVQAYPIGCKNPSLEENFYEICDQDNIEIIDVKAMPILEVTSTGVKTSGKEIDLDILVFATGWDSHIGSILDIDIRGLGGETIKDHWRAKDGVKTYLGVTVDNFPNFFFLYGPQAPTALCNGPSCAEVQGAWVIKTIDWLRQRGITKFNPSTQAAQAYKDHIEELSRATLLPKVASFWMGANVPGKRVEAYNYSAGLKMYKEELAEEAEHGYPGFLRDALRQTVVA
ncbi:cyclohexanone monooxygenase [Boletus reticuloceps]|uniref:Cyclohexanone monooxygenase n=1 Tax=Boletus reticuloceps TaxID=495285 RepID=A0A8I2YIT8_9AGAM|nr:cyclohexanone monooxygenase [Boletus reticuloceps]